MRRIRTIKPELLEDEVVAGLPHLQWRLFVSLLLLADDYGNLRGRAAMIRGAALWSCPEGDSQVQAALDGLMAQGLLQPYTVRGQTYLHIAGWEKHQRVDKPGKPGVPGPLEDSRESRECLANDSRESRECLANDSRESRETVATDRDLDQDRDRDLEREPRAPARDPRTPDPDVAARRAAVDALWSEHQAARRAVAADLGVEALDLHPHDGGKAELAARLREAMTAGEALAVAAERCRRVLGRVAADCRRDRTLDWLDGQLWRRDRFDRAYAKAASPAPQRAGPRQSGIGALLEDIAAAEAKEVAT
jgi:hypothetical protein